MYEQLKALLTPPSPFSAYTAADLWTDPHRARQMLRHHLDVNIEAASRTGDFIQRSLIWITETFEVGPDVSICDFGCGPGLYTLPLALQGAQVTGLDFSPYAIEHARSDAQGADLAIQYEMLNYLDYESPERFDLILMLMWDYGSLSPAQRQRLCQIFYRQLKPGGRVLLDVRDLTAFAKLRPQTRLIENSLGQFWAAGDYLCLHNTFVYADDHLALDHYHIMEATGISYSIYNWVQYFSPASLRQEFVDAGFEVMGIYGDAAGSPYQPGQGEFALLTQRPVNHI